MNYCYQYYHNYNYYYYYYVTNTILRLSNSDNVRAFESTSGIKITIHINPRFTVMKIGFEKA